MSTTLQRYGLRNTKWNRILVDEIIPLIKDYHAKGTKPSVRGLHYNLTNSGRGHPNTKSFYQKMCTAIVKAKKEGLIRWDALRDNTRRNIGDYHHESPGNYIDRGIYHLKTAPDYFRPYRWHKQPHYIEVWIEKEAMAGEFEEILEGQDIIIVVNRGYSSWTALHKNCMRLRQLREDNPSLEIHILYFGDLDPSGMDMENQMLEAFREFGLIGDGLGYKDIHFERMAVTKGQIERFDLPQSPEDIETLEKIKKDPRYQSSIAANNGELYAVELDALYALHPEEFKKLVLEPIQYLFDEEINEGVISDPEFQPDAIRELVSKKIEESGLCD